MLRKLLAMMLSVLLVSSCAAAESEEKTWPTVTGTFIQPDAFLSYSVSRWEKHFDRLLEAGIDTVILQWIATTPYAKVSNLYYASDISFEKTADFACSGSFLSNVLAAAKEKGIKVFVGLNISDEWWVQACAIDLWNRAQADLGLAIARDIWDQYKEEYPDTLYGWYFPWEMFNGMYGQEKKAGHFLNMYLTGLTQIDPSMPLMLSPFVRSVGGSPEKAEKEWKKVFEYAEFREGDIFCCQDAVGAGHITIDEMDAYFVALKRAVDTEVGLQFWANNECFNSDYTPASVDRFVRQLALSDPYVTGHVTFAYSHYYSPDYTQKIKYHEAYLQYLHTGRLPSEED